MVSFLLMDRAKWQALGEIILDFLVWSGQTRKTNMKEASYADYQYF